jgi:hypothetical protein
MNLSLVSVVPWREFVPAADHRPESDFIVSVFMERVYGKPVATAFTLLVLWTTVGSVFALMLGYSRIPYAAALDGYFFRVFGRLHPTKNFPHVSLLVIGGISIACCVLPLEAVIDGLILTRVLVQFIGQIHAVALLRQHRPDMPRPYRIWLYPVPNLVALLGWLFVFSTADMPMKLLGLGMAALGVLIFLAWSWHTSRWPFAPATPSFSPEPPATARAGARASAVIALRAVAVGSGLDDARATAETCLAISAGLGWPPCVRRKGLLDAACEVALDRSVWRSLVLRRCDSSGLSTGQTTCGRRRGLATPGSSCQGGQLRSSPQDRPRFIGDCRRRVAGRVGETRDERGPAAGSTLGGLVSAGMRPASGRVPVHAAAKGAADRLHKAL